MKSSSPRPVVILVADDDEDDRLLAREALAEGGVAVDFREVGDGDLLLDYLYRRGDYAGPGAAPRPDLVLLDLNMPRTDGREALRRIRAEPALRAIPVVVMTTSRAPGDIADSYELGANSVIVKPATFRETVEVMRVVARYWFETARLPPAPGDT